MALAKLGSIFSSISGSIGGLIAANSNSGTTLRTKSSKINKLLSSTQAPRINISVLANSWQVLTAAQKATWQSFATFANISQRRTKGMNISGMQLFYQINHYRLMYNDTILANPTFDATLPSEFTISLPTAGGGIAFDPGRSMVSANEMLLLWATAPLRSGVNNFENKLRLIVVATPNADHVHFYNEYQAVFGLQPVATQIIGCKATFMNYSTGLMLPFHRSIITLA